MSSRMLQLLLSCYRARHIAFGQSGLHRPTEDLLAISYFVKSISCLMSYEQLQSCLPETDSAEVVFKEFNRFPKLLATSHI